MNLVLVGLGYWGPNLLRTFNNLGVLYGACDRDTERTLKFRADPLYKELKFNNDWRTFLKNDEVDGFIIATPPNTHYEIAKEVIAVNKHVFVEKPMTLDVAEAKDLVKAALSKNIVVMVGHIFLYSPEIIKLKEIIQSPDFGDIYYVYTQRLNLGKIQSPANVIEDLAPHDISILNYILGAKCVEVLATADSHVLKDIVDVAFVNMKFDNGAAAHLHLSWLDPLKVRNTVVVGSKQMVVCDSGTKKIDIYNMGVDIDKRKDISNTSYAQHLLSYRYGDVISPYIESGEPMMAEAKEFVRCIEEGDTPLASGRLGLDVVLTLAAMQRSLKRGQVWEKV